MHGTIAAPRPGTMITAPVIVIVVAVIALFE